MDAPAPERRAVERRAVERRAVERRAVERRAVERRAVDQVVTPLHVTERLRVAIAERRPLLRTLLGSVLHGDGCEVVSEASGASGLRTSPAALPDVVVVGSQLDDGSVEDAVTSLVALSLPVFVLTADRSPDTTLPLLLRGASGCAAWDDPPEVVVAGVRSVAAGAIAVDVSTASALVREWRRLRTQVEPESHRRRTLTAREMEVLVAMTDGLSTKAVGRRLGVATKTVENHKIRIFDKLGVRTQAHAVSVAIQHGLLADRPSPVDAPSSASTGS